MQIQPRSALFILSSIQVLSSVVAARSRSKGSKHAAAKEPSSPRFITEPEGAVGQKGHTVKLYCAVSGYPYPEVTWFYNGLKVELSNRRLSNGNDLMLIDFDASLAGTYFCEAENTLGSIKSKEIQAELLFFDGKFKESPKETEGDAGSEVQLTCGPPGGFPKPEVTWYKDQKLLTPDNRRIRDEVMSNGKHYLVISKLKESDRGFYVCAAENSVGRNTTEKVYLRVNNAPYFFQSLPEFVQVEANVEAVLPCPISGEPKPEITWTKVNSNLPSKRILGSNGELRIPQMNPEDQGIYRCTGSNDLDSISGQIELRLSSGPKFLSSPKNITIREGKIARFSCRITAIPAPVVIWKKASDLIVNDRHFDVKSNGELTIQNVGENDAGEYTCIGKNDFGQIAKTVSLEITKFDLREPPVIRGVSFTDGALACEMQNANENDTVWKFNSDVLRTSAFYTPSENGTYSCSVSNDFGMSEFSFAFPLLDNLVFGIVKNLKLMRTQADAIIVTFDALEAEDDDFRLFQLDNSISKFKPVTDLRSADNLNPDDSTTRKFKVHPQLLLADEGSFFIQDLKSNRSSFTTGLVDLSARELDKSIDADTLGIRPARCMPGEGFVEIFVDYAKSIENSCSSGLSVVSDGPVSDSKMISCGSKKTIIDTKEEKRGKYKIRIESRENNELGAFFIVNSDGGSSIPTCIDKLITSFQSKVNIESQMVDLTWTKNPLIDDVFIDSYLIMWSSVAASELTDDALEYRDDGLNRIQHSEVAQPLQANFRYSLPLTAERNYSITVTPLISLAQGIPAKLTTSPSPDDFFPNLVKSPLFIAIICAVSAIFFIIVGAVVFQCFRSPLPPHKRCYRSTEHHNGTRTVLTKGTTYEEPQNWNEILGQNLLPDPTMPISNGNPYSRGNDLSMSYLSTKNDDIRSSHADSINMHHQQTPDIQSAHYTVAPVQSELVKLDLLEGTYLNSSKRMFHGQSTARSLPPPPALPSALQNSSHSSSISVMSNGDYRDRSSPHISSNRVTYRPRQMSNPPTNSDSDYQELEVEHYRTVQTNRSRNSNQMPYYDINEFKPLYSNRPIYSEIPSSNDAYNYRRDTSFFLQSNSGGNLPSEHASLSPVNEV